MVETKDLKRGEGNGGKGSRRGGETTCQRHGNWEQNKVMALIKCKHIKHVIQKELINPWAHHGTYCGVVEQINQITLKVNPQ